jgi:hypothetical protein
MIGPFQDLCHLCDELVGPSDHREVSRAGWGVVSEAYDAWPQIEGGTSRRPFS